MAGLYIGLPYIGLPGSQDDAVAAPTVRFCLRIVKSYWDADLAHTACEEGQHSGET
jgi:hypothetical protein